MKGKASLILGLATGYVLGTRDGRERYEQIKAQANRLWNDPKVQAKASQAGDLVKDNAPKVQQKVTDAAHQAGDKVKDKAGRGSDSSTGSDSGTGLDSGTSDDLLTGTSVGVETEVVSVPDMPAAPLDVDAPPLDGGHHG